MMKLGVFTVSAPEYEPLELMELVAEIGYDGVEWRVCDDDGDRSKPSFWSGNRAGMTAGEMLERAEELKAKADALKLAMPSLGAYITCEDMAAVELHFKAAVAIGASTVRVGPLPYDREKSFWDQMNASRARYADVVKLAEQYGIRAVIETHMNQLGPTVFRARWMMEGLDPRYVGIMWDPGNQVMEGREVYATSIDCAGEYLAEVHVKNLAYYEGEMSQQHRLWTCPTVPVQKGIVDWVDVVKLLKQYTYDGWVFFEDFSTETSTVDKLKENLTWFKALLA